MKALILFLFLISSTYAQSLTATPSTISAGGLLTVNWSGVTGATPGDWIGLYAPETSNDLLVAKAWIYTSCSQTQGTALVSGVCYFQLPAVPLGISYELRLFANRSLQLIAISQSFQVIAPAPPSCGTLVLSSYGATYSGIDLPLAGRPYTVGSFPFPYTVPLGRTFLISSMHRQGKKFPGTDGIVRSGGVVLPGIFTFNSESPAIFPVPLPIPSGTTIDGYFGNDTISEPMNQILIIVGTITGADCPQ